MGTAVFYHLTEAGLEETVAMILGRALGQGWRVMLRGRDMAMLRHLDQALWRGPEESFLPHGLAGGAQDGDQPVLLGTGAIGNGAQGLMLVGGAGVAAEEVAGLERVWVLFDGHDPEAVQAARGMWISLTGWGMGAQYWSDAGGGWVKKSEKAAG